MIIILQGNDVMLFSPITGDPIKVCEYTTTETYDGRTVVAMGDCNIQIQTQNIK
jgi:hypothetical protein